MDDQPALTISLMIAVEDVAAAIDWYRQALGAQVQWSLGSVAALRISGAPILLAEPANNGWEAPSRLGTTTARIEVFTADPDGFIARGVEAGATVRDPIQNYDTPWGQHRQGTFTDPFGHLWFVGDHSPLDATG